MNTILVSNSPMWLNVGANNITVNMSGTLSNGISVVAAGSSISSVYVNSSLCTHIGTAWHRGVVGTSSAVPVTINMSAQGWVLVSAFSYGNELIGGNSASGWEPQSFVLNVATKNGGMCVGTYSLGSYMGSRSYTYGGYTMDGQSVGEDGRINYEWSHTTNPMTGANNDFRVSCSGSGNYILSAGVASVGHANSPSVLQVPYMIF